MSLTGTGNVEFVVYEETRTRIWTRNLWSHLPAEYMCSKARPRPAHQCGVPSRYNSDQHTWALVDSTKFQVRNGSTHINSRDAHFCRDKYIYFDAEASKYPVWGSAGPAATISPPLHVAHHSKADKCDDYSVPKYQNAQERYSCKRQREVCD